MAGNGHVDQGRCPDIDLFLTINLALGCRKRCVKRQGVEVSAWIKTMRLMRKILCFTAKEPERGITDQERVSDKTLKAGSVDRAAKFAAKP